MIKCLELRPIDGRKSFYGKATAFYDDNAEAWYLKSYDTIVAIYYVNSGRFIRRWNDYSVTTMRHVNAFLSFLGYEAKTKTWWINLPMFCGVLIED